jgi:hypothetical protein
MLLTLAVILLVAWLVGFGIFQLAGTVIRVLIVLAVVALIFRMVWGRPGQASVTDRSTSGTAR